MRSLPVLALTAAAGLLLTGCSASVPTGSTKAATYQSLEQLKSAYTAAGGTCPVWLEDDDIQAAAQSGTCGNEITLSTYLNGADLLGQVKLLRDTASSGDDGTSEPTRTELLIGSNWLASGPHVRRLQAKMGGQLAVINPAAGN